MKLGEPFQHPLPKIDGDPFAQLLESRRKKDSARCDAWKDEVNNLLIFVSSLSIQRPTFEIIFPKGRSVLGNRHCVHHRIVQRSEAGLERRCKHSLVAHPRPT